MGWAFIDTLPFFKTLLLSGMLFFFAAALGVFYCRNVSEQRIGKLTRSYALGIPLGILALWWVLPHAAIFLNYVESPNDALKLLPYGVIALIFFFYFLDYIGSRALSVVIILWSYSVIIGAYAFDGAERSFLRIIFTISAFLVGSLAIYLAAKPHALRDILVCASQPDNRKTRLFLILVFALLGLLCAGYFARMIVS